MTRKNFVLFATLTLTLLLCACGKQEGGEKTLRQQGMELIGLMAEMAASDEYGALIGADNQSFGSLRSELASGDYAAPLAVYELSAPTLREVLSVAGEEDAWSGLPESLLKYMDSRSISSLAAQLNSMEGTSALALSSLYTASKTFVSSRLEQDIIYLYTFEKGYSVAVSFIGGENHAVLATGTFILIDGFDGSSLEQIQDLLKGMGLGYSFRLLEEE